MSTTQDQVKNINTEGETALLLTGLLYGEKVHKQL